MKVKDVALAVERIVPLKLAQDWDNVGLLVGDWRREVRNVLLTIDVTSGVVAEAKRLKTDLILSYHPVIWDGLKSVTAAGPGRIVHELARSDMSVFSVHTALDTVAGGVNDGLAEMVGIANAEPIGDFVDAPFGDSYRLVVFVPADALDVVANAAYEAGAGVIGNYSHCGFAGEGTGTFLPLAGSQPTIGRKGKFERVHELRFETVVPTDRLGRVVGAVVAAHPYETPAFDVIRLHNERSRFGLGRIGVLVEPRRLDDIVETIRKVTGAKAIGVVGKPKRLVKTAAVCAGACGKIIHQVIAAGADLYLTGELKHHQALAAQEAGLTCLCLSHTVSERFILKKFARQLRQEIKRVNIRVSRVDADPFTWKSI